jgi:hypothetical protein
MVSAVANGDLPIPRDPEVVAPMPSPPKPVTVRLFAMKPVTWRDVEGLQRFVGKFNDVDLPETAAAFALEKGFCVELTDPKRKQLHGTSPGRPDHHWCTNLDDENETAAAEAQARRPEEQRVLNSRIDPNLEIVDRGKAYTLRTNGPEAA